MSLHPSCVELCWCIHPVVCLLVQAEWERDDSLNQNTLESFLLSWRQARQRQLDADKEVVQPKRTSKQLCGRDRARGGAGGAAEPRQGEIGADKDIVTDMFPL